MRKVFAVAVSVLMMAGVASAAPTLSYAPGGDTSGTTTVTAADGATNFWEMEINTNTASSKGGAIWSFKDKSGASDPDFTYAHTYVTQDPGLIYRTGAISMDDGVTALSVAVEGASAMAYTATRTVTQVSTGGVATYTSAFTINAPVATAQGYDTNITIEETYAFDALWEGVNGDARANPAIYLYSDENGLNDEWTGTSYNGFLDDPQTNYQTATGTVTANDAAMAEGSTFMLTSTWTTADGAYDSATTGYGSHGDDYFALRTDIGVTGAWAGNPGAAGSARSFTSTSELDISIVPEPATMGLLGLGLIGLVARRKK